MKTITTQKVCFGPGNGSISPCWCGHMYYTMYIHKTPDGRVSEVRCDECNGIIDMKVFEKK